MTLPDDVSEREPVTTEGALQRIASMRGDMLTGPARDAVEIAQHALDSRGDPVVTGWTQFYDYEAEIEGGDTLAIHTDGHKDGGFGISDPDVLLDLRDMIDHILSAAPTEDPNEPA